MVRVKKVKKGGKDFRWVGVRFITGHDIAKIYTYKIRRGVKIHLGQELVVRNQYGTSIVVVVQLDQNPTLMNVDITNWKWITEKVAKL